MSKATISIEWDGGPDVPGVLQKVCDLVMTILCATPGVENPGIDATLDGTKFPL